MGKMILEKQETKKKVEKEKKEKIDYTQKEEKEEIIHEQVVGNNLLRKEGKRKIKDIYYEKPIRYLEKKSKKYQKIELELEEKSKTYENEKNTFFTKFYKGNKGQKIVDINQGDIILKYDFSSKDPEIQKEKNKITYKNVNPGIDIEYILLEDKVKETIIINQRQEKYEFDCQMLIQDYELKIDENKQTLLIIKENKVKYELTSPYMIDKEGNISTNCRYEIEQEEQGLKIKIIADEKWINDTTKRLPIKIDPTIVVKNDEGIITTNFKQSDISIEGLHKNIGYFNGVTYSMNIDIDLETLINNNTDIDVKLKVNYLWELDPVQPIKMIVNEKEEKINLDNAKQYIEIDLNPYIKDNEELSELKISFLPSVTTAHMVKIKSTELEVEYTNKKLKSNNHIFREYNLNRAGMLKWNIPNKYFTERHYDMSITTKELSIDIYHIYNELLGGKGYDKHPTKGKTQQYRCGRNWKTNLHQNLIKTRQYDNLKGGYLITYIDGEGFHHELVEKWYYKTNNQKNYISKEEVELDVDGKLKYVLNDEVYEVNYEVSNEEELMYVSSSSMYNYNQLQEKTKLIKRYVLLKDGEKINVYVDENNQAYVPYFYYCEGENLEEIIVPNSTIYQDYLGRYKTTTLGLQDKQILYSEVKVSKDINSVVIGNQAVYIYTETTDIYNDIDNNVDYFINEEISQINEKILSVQESIKNYQKNITEYHEYIKDIYATIEEQSESENKVANSNSYKQKNKYYNKFLEIHEQINYYQDLLDRLKKQKEELVNQQLKNVNDMIVDKENNVLCFDGYGKLVAIKDNKENEIIIEYEEDKIVKVRGEKEKIEFKYNDSGLLEYMIDPLGKKIQFTYSSGSLLEITYSDNQTTIFTSTEGVIDKIQEPRGLICTKTTNNVKLKTKVESISSTGKTYLTEEKEILSESYDNVFFDTITNTQGERINYIFNDTNQLITLIADDKLQMFDYDENRVLYNLKESENGKIKNFSSYNQDITYTLEDTITNSITQILKSKFKNHKIAGLYAFIPCVSTSNIELTIEVSYSDYRVQTFTTKKQINKPTYIQLPFVVGTNSTSINVVVNSDMNSENTGYEPTFYLSLFEGVIYTYTENKQLIREETQNSTTNYFDFINDKPTKIIYNDKTQSITTKMYYNADNLLICKLDDKGNCIEYTYDDKNNCIQTKSYNTNDPSLCNIVKDEKHSNNTTFNNYDYLNNNVTSLYSDINGYNNKNNHKYSYDLLTSLNHPGMNIDYSYDVQGRVKSVTINNQLIKNVEYHDNYTDTTYGSNCNKTITTLINGEVKTKIYDSDGKLRKYINGSEENEYTYDADLRLLSNGTRQYVYDNEGRITTKSSVDNDVVLTSETYTYENDKLSLINIKFLDNKGNYSTKYTYDANNNLTAYTNSFSFNISYEYDALNRIISEEYTSSNKFTPTIKYEYLQKKDSTTPFVKEQTIYLNEVNEKIENIYDYDKNNNITTILKNDKITKYTYDKQNRLVREDNQSLNKTYTYKYNTAGNIIAKKEYAYTLDEILPLQPITNNQYRYSLTGWKDRLEMYDNLIFTYDKMGYPTKYKGETMTWDAGRLISYKGVTNTYNKEGIRTSKTVNGVTTTYYVMDNRIYKMEDTNGNMIVFLYSIDKLIGFRYNDIRYFYVRNIQGDITHIYKEDKSLVARYEYNAWGSHEVYDGEGNINTALTFIGNMNPFRYRGYFYDRDMGLYYLNSRYYDSEVCRFISPDSIEYLDPSSINGLNLYSYCGNDPINKYDPTGHFPWLILAAVLLFTPVGGTALQVAASVGSYAVMSVWALGDLVFNNGDGAWADMCSINWNPFNSNESATLNSNYVSFYKGVPVFRTNMSRSGSFSIIFLARGSSENDLRHERGHNSQLMMMGIANYGLGIGIPSLFMFGPWAAQGGDNYYRAPWEITADRLGGVSRPVHTQEDIDYGWWYLKRLIGFPFISPRYF